MNSNRTVSKSEESAKRKLSYEEEGEPAKAKMKRINKGGTGKYRGAPLKYHVRLIVAERPTTSEAAIFKSIDNIHDNSLVIKNFRQQDDRQALRGGPTTLISMTADQIYSMFSEEEESFEKFATSIYQADTLTLLDAIRDPEVAETLYQKTEKNIPIKNEDTVILQGNNQELAPTKRANMVRMYL